MVNNASLKQYVTGSSRQCCRTTRPIPYCGRVRCKRLACADRTPSRAARHPDLRPLRAAGSCQACGRRWACVQLQERTPNVGSVAARPQRQGGHTPPEAMLTSGQPAMLPRHLRHQRWVLSQCTRARADLTSLLRLQSMHKFWWEHLDSPSRHASCLLQQPCLTTGAALGICHFR